MPLITNIPKDISPNYISYPFMYCLGLIYRYAIIALFHEEDTKDTFWFGTVKSFDNVKGYLWV